MSPGDAPTRQFRGSPLAPIGFYVHHEGRGHANRALLLARSLRRPTTLFTSRPDYVRSVASALPDCEVIGLPHDLYGDSPEAYAQSLSPAGPTLHYAPLQVEGIRQRMGRLAAWIVGHRPALMVVDVSVEVATLCRLLSVPTVVVRLQGWRDDLAHQATFAHARAILCPFHEAFELYRLPDPLQRKTYYTGAYSRFGGSDTCPSPRRHDVGVEGGLRIVVMVSPGATQRRLAELRSLAEAVPAAKVIALGFEPASALELPANLEVRGFEANPWTLLREADVVVAGAGTSTVMEVGAARRPLVCIPERRAFDEQRNKAFGLARAGVAVAVQHWPSAARWPAVISRALGLRPELWTGYFRDPDLSAAAAYLESLARESDPTHETREARQFPAPTLAESPPIVEQGGGEFGFGGEAQERQLLGVGLPVDEA